MAQQRVDMAFLQETWLTAKQDLHFTEYNVYRNDRAGLGGHSRGGGTAIVVKKTLATVLVPIAKLARLTKLEATAVMIDLGGGRRLFCISIYSRPSRANSIPELERVFDTLCLGSTNNEYIIGGDFNAPHVHWGYEKSTTVGGRLFGWLERQSPVYGTRVLASALASRPLTKGFPDLFMIKSTIDLREVRDGVINALDSNAVSFSDHTMVRVRCWLPSNEPLPVPTAQGRFGKLRRVVAKLDADKFRGYVHSNRDLHGLSEEVVNELGSRNLTEEEINRLTESFTELLVTSMELSVPERRPPTTPPLPGVIRYLTKKKRLLVRSLFSTYRWTRRGDPVAAESIRRQKAEIEGVAQEIKGKWQEIQWQRNITNLDRVRTANPSDFFREIKNVYQRKKTNGHDHESFLFDDTLGNRLLLASTTPITLSNGQLVVSGGDIDTVLGNVLESTFNPAGSGRLVEGSVSGLGKVQFRPDLRSDNMNDTRFISSETLDDLIKSLNRKHSSGPDGIPNSVIKLLPRFCRRILLILHNNCINLNRLPSAWKVSTVVFIKKDTNKWGDVGNYRPISLMSNLSKVLETFFVRRLEAEAEANNLISWTQFGFMRGRSTTHAINRLVGMIQDGRAQNHIVGAVFIDIRKAFDSVDHKLLIQRLRAMAISSDVVDFFENFLAGRRFISTEAMSQVERVSDLQHAQGHKINSGVLQGSISGPLLFILFIDELLREIPTAEGFADDLVFTHSRERVAPLEAELNYTFQKLCRITTRLKLKINMDKTKVMLFYRAEHADSDYTAMNGIRVEAPSTIDPGTGRWIAGQILEKVDSFNYLGVTLDKFLRFDKHVEKIVQSTRRAYMACENIIKLRGLEEHRRVWVYKTAIRPLLTYACPVWALVAPRLMRDVIRAEYHILRALFAKYRRPNGHFVSYRSRLVKADLPGVDYQIIKLTKRFLIRLCGTEYARVRQDNPDLKKWMDEIYLIRQGLFVPESLMFLDALGILQDPQGRNGFYALPRAIDDRRFDLAGARVHNGHRNRMRLPNKLEIKTIEGLDPPWKSWTIPGRYQSL